MSDELLRRQLHTHRKTCKRNVGDCVICRFHFPKYPLPHTMVMRLIEDAEIEQLVGILNAVYGSL